MDLEFNFCFVSQKQNFYELSFKIEILEHLHSPPKAPKRHLGASVPKILPSRALPPKLNIYPTHPVETQHTGGGGGVRGERGRQLCPKTVRAIPIGETSIFPKSAIPSHPLMRAGLPPSWEP
jgi:hypothetical protein